MRYFELLNFQNVAGFVFPTITFMIVFFVGLAFMHFRGKGSEERKSEILHRFPGGIEDRNEPFPLVMILIIAGTVLWAFFYILMNSVLGVII
jgi:hypothetical protein